VSFIAGVDLRFGFPDDPGSVIYPPKKHVEKPWRGRLKPVFAGFIDW